MADPQTQRYYVLGTAGHIDHGKSALVKALTGIDPDRLKEEKIRGITIELGFAHLAYDDGTLLGIVDVPGHERFVRHMVAGATGIDLVALVVAADEGVMPQTREHLDICSLLGVKTGLVVLTKTDLVHDREWLDLVEEDIRDFLQGTFLEDCPIVRTSAMTGEGLEELRTQLRDAAVKSPPKPFTGLFRLPVDRVFTMRGFGTVITGTLVSGSLRVGDRVFVYPPKFEARVRGVQVHSREVEEALAGQRTAVNLQGVEKAAIKRGFLLAGEGDLPVSVRVDVEVKYLKAASKPLKNRAKVRFHTFTSEVMAEVALLERERLEPGETGYAQIITEEPVSVLREDRFVVRSYSPVFTIGGGRVLHPEPPRHRKKHHWVIHHLKDLATGDVVKIVRVHLTDAGPRGLVRGELAVAANIYGEELDGVLKDGEDKGWAVPLPQEPGRYLSLEVLDSLKSEVQEVLSAYHRANPLKRGMPKDEIGPRLSVDTDPKVMAAVLGFLEREERVFIEGTDARLRDHRVDLTGEERALREKLGAIYLKAGLSPPFFRDVLKELSGSHKSAQGILDIMVKEGELVKVKEDMFFHRDALNELKGRVVDFLKEHREMDTSQFKSLTGTSRKYTIPLAEYFDKARVTIRVGERRRLREAGAREDS